MHAFCADAPLLEAIDLAGTDADDHGLETIAKLPGLKFLGLKYCRRGRHQVTCNPGRLRRVEVSEWTLPGQ
ncbi:MAG: hypothetical protein ACK5Q5_19880 [Planctomycetaceae bacterium]